MDPILVYNYYLSYNLIIGIYIFICGGSSVTGGSVRMQIPASYFASQSPQPGIMQPTIPAPPPNLNAQSNQHVLPENISKSEDFLRTRCSKARGQFPSESCNKYVNCWDGTIAEEVCPEGLLFNPKGYCDYPENVHCHDKRTQGVPPSVPITTTTDATSASVPILSTIPPTLLISLPSVDPNLRKKCKYARGQFPSDSCDKYVNCWDDVIIEQDCPDGLLFSVKGYCDYPHKVSCHNRYNSHSKNQNSDADHCPLDFGTFRDKFNCSVYYTCLGGKVAAKYSCPEGLSYNDRLGVCDYSERVTTCNNEPLVFSPKANFLENVPADFMDKIDSCKPGQVIPLNPECTTACLCRDSLSEIIQCPRGLAYDSKTDKCMLPQFAKC